MDFNRYDKETGPSLTDQSESSVRRHALVTRKRGVKRRRVGDEEELQSSKKSLTFGHQLTPGDSITRWPYATWASMADTDHVFQRDAQLIDRHSGLTSRMRTPANHYLATRTPETSLRDVIGDPFHHFLVSRLIGLSIMDERSLQFPYNVIVATALYYYSSRDFALSVSGLRWEDLLPCIRWMQPFRDTIIANDQCLNNENLGMKRHDTNMSLFDKAPNALHMDTVHKTPLQMISEMAEVWGLPSSDPLVLPVQPQEDDSSDPEGQIPVPLKVDISNPGDKFIKRLHVDISISEDESTEPIINVDDISDSDVETPGQSRDVSDPPLFHVGPPPVQPPWTMNIDNNSHPENKVSEPRERYQPICEDISDPPLFPGPRPKPYWPRDVDISEKSYWPRDVDISDPEDEQVNIIHRNNLQLIRGNMDIFALSRHFHSSHAASTTTQAESWGLPPSDPLLLPVQPRQLP